MSTEEIIQRTRLLDSEIKVGAWLRCMWWNPNKTCPADPNLLSLQSYCRRLGAYLLEPEKAKKKTKS